MKKNIGNYFYILVFIIFAFYSCEKKIDLKDEYNAVPLAISKEAEETIIKSFYDLQDQIENFDENYILLFQENGNFTNSGNKEILGFYESKSMHLNREITSEGISAVYCFIIDEQNQEIQKALKIRGYGTAEMDKYAYLDEMPLNALGREIKWLDKRFGYIGDFNNNGKEELYFFESSSIGTFPRFYEFDGNNFRKILDNNTYYLDLNKLNITSIDMDNKIINFENKIDEGPVKTISLVWTNMNQSFMEIVD